MRLLSSLWPLLVLLVSSKQIPTPALSAESEGFRKQVLSRQPVAEAAMRPAEKLAAYAKYDFSPLWLRENDEAVYGFIGARYQRLQVKLLTIQKSAADPALYSVTGKTRVLGVVRAFRGTVRLQQVREALNRQLPPREEWLPKVAAAGIAVTGTAVARYDFFEDSTQTKAGVFRGVLATYWYTDQKLRLHYDDLEGYSDSFTNNQFVGTWTSYARNQPLRCNWGDFRAPNSGGLDMGAGEFSPADKYYSSGWQYFAALYGTDKTARKRAELLEKQTWWK